MLPSWERLLEAVYDVCSAIEPADCLRRIELHASSLFVAFAPAVRLELDGVVPQGGFPLSAHGRRLGYLSVTGEAEVTPEAAAALSAFADHAGLALANVQLLDESEHRARRDPLTGLRNYREFHDTLATHVPEHEASLSVVALDLDRFKEVNDRDGHAAGDRLLRATAAALSAVCRGSDAAFRIGGDEFALLLPGASRAQAVVVAERAAAAIARLADSLGTSWGVAASPEDGIAHDQLVFAADVAMYQNKGQTHVSTALERGHARRRLEVTNRLATRLVTLHDPPAIATAVVDELHSTFGYYLAVVHRLDDNVLRVVAGAGPLAETNSRFLAWEQPITSGVNGRVARTAVSALIHDTRLDPDYLAIDPREDPGSELSVPIMVNGSVWGVLNLEQIARHSFDEVDVLLAEAVVAHTGAALHRCSL